MSPSPQPNFLVIGAQRCATSWLYFCLKEHPQIYVPYIKEVGYFNAHYDKGPEWYAEHFKQWKGQKAVGEVTPAYLFRPGTAERIAKDLPGVKLIVIFRNPVERAFSQYKKNLRGGNLNAGFEQALEQMPEIVDRGRYFPQLSRFTALFPKKNILPLVYEDIERDPKAYLRKIFSFLEVDADFLPPSALSIVPSENLARGAYSKVTKLSQFLRKNMRAGVLVDAAKKLGLKKWAEPLFYRFSPAPKTKRVERQAVASEIKPETRERLQLIFKDDNEKLARYLGRDLSFWR